MVLLKLNSKAGANKEESGYEYHKEESISSHGPHGFVSQTLCHHAMKHVTTSPAPSLTNTTLPRVHSLDITSLSVPSEPTDTIHTLPSSLSSQ